MTATELTEYLQHVTSSCSQSQGHSPAIQWIIRIVNPGAVVIWGGKYGKDTGCCLAKIMGGVSYSHPQHRTHIEALLWQVWKELLLTLHLLLRLVFASFWQIWEMVLRGKGLIQEGGLSKECPDLKSSEGAWGSWSSLGSWPQVMWCLLLFPEIFIVSKATKIRTLQFQTPLLISRALFPQWLLVTALDTTVSFNSS